MKDNLQGTLLTELKRSKNYSKSWFWKLRMRDQALLQFFFIFILMLGLVLGIYLVNMAIIIPLLQSASFEIYNFVAQNTLQSHVQGYDGILNGIFNINIHQLEIIHQIYNQAYRKLEKQDNITLDHRSHMDYAGTNKMPHILVDQPQGSYAKTHSFMCYTNKTNITLPMDKTTLINLKIQETMYPIGQILDAQKLNIQSLFYIATLDEPQVYFSFPCTNFGSFIYKLIIPQRPWFLKGLQIYNQTNFSDYDYQFTDPFLQFTKDKIEVTLVMPLLDQKLNLKGIMASDLGTDLSKFVVKTDQNVSMILLADQKGILIYHSFNVSLALQPIYIYNTSLTGFTMEDWKAIKETKQSNCSSYDTNSSLLCRYNSVYEKDLVITIHEVKRFKFIFMMYKFLQIRFHDITIYTEYQKESQQRMLDQLQNSAIQFLEIAIAVFSITMLMSISILIIIFRPIQNIINNCHQIMGMKNKQQVQQKILFQKIFVPTVNIQLQALFISYTDLVRRFLQLSYTKGNTCKTIEARVYPKKIKEKAYDKLEKYLNKKIEFLRTDKRVKTIFRVPTHLLGRYIEKILYQRA